MRESRASIDTLLASRGVSRREFVAYCGALAAAIGLGDAAAPRVAGALSLAAARKPVVWLSLGSCGGCTTSLLQAGKPDVASTVLELISAEWWEPLMASAGEEALEARSEALERGGYLLVVEGAVMRGFEGNACRIAGRTGLTHLREAAAKADAVIAVGSCAVDGGWMGAAPSDFSARGAGVRAVRDQLGGKPLVNLPTCPVNPEWLVAVVAEHLVRGKLPELDSQGRPKRLYGASIHDGCPRRGHFDNGRFVESPGSAEEAAGWCLYKLGCKGPETFAPCPHSRWNREASWCVESGGACVGCANGDWVSAGAPFRSRLPDVVGVRPETIGIGLAALAGTGLALHGGARLVSAVLRHGEGPATRPEERPVEEPAARDADDERKAGEA